MIQSLPTLKKKLSSQENTTTMGFLDKLCRQKESSIGPKGKTKNKTLDSSELKVLEEAGFYVTFSLPFFPSYKHGDFVTYMAKMQNSRMTLYARLGLLINLMLRNFLVPFKNFASVMEHQLL